MAALEQGGDHREIAFGLGAAFAHGSHTVANIQFQVPQQPYERLDLLAFLALVFHQNEQVHVGFRVQLATPVAADREQCQPFVVLEPVLPDLREEPVDERRALAHQHIDILAAPEPFRQGFVGLVYAPFQRGNVELGVVRLPVLHRVA